MPSIGHIAVGMAAGRGYQHTGRGWRWIAWLAALSCAADLDLILMAFGTGSNSLSGHRGVSHSLAAALLAGLISAAVARRWGSSAIKGGLAGFLVYTSHLALDCLSAGTLGVPWFWPLDGSYYSLPWHPIPAVISARDFLSWRGVPVLLAEALIFSPFVVYALWRRPGGGPAGRAGRSRPASAPWRRRLGVERGVE